MPEIATFLALLVLAVVLLVGPVAVTVAWLRYLTGRDEDAQRERYEWAERLQRPGVRPAPRVEEMIAQDIAKAMDASPPPEPDEVDLVGTIQPEPQEKE